jgi:hypothetical protein
MACIASLPLVRFWRSFSRGEFVALRWINVFSLAALEHMNGAGPTEYVCAFDGH